MADQLVTPLELASFLQQDLDASTANLLIDLATGIVQGIVGQRLVEVTDTALLDVADYCDQWLELPQRPVRSVATVVLDGIAVTDWRLRNQKLWRLTGWVTVAGEPSQAKVTSTHGYPSGSQYLHPARSAVFSLAAAGYGNPGQTQSEAIDDYRVSFDDALSRMQVTEPLHDALVATYGTAAYVSTSR